MSVTIKYTSSRENEYTLSAGDIRIKEANFHDWTYTLNGSNRQHGYDLRSFNRDPISYYATLYFGGDPTSRKALIEELHDEWEYDLVNCTPGTLTWGQSSIQCFIISSSTYPAYDNWGTLNEITIYCPDPTWERRQSTVVPIRASQTYTRNTGLLWSSPFQVTIPGPTTVNPIVLSCVNQYGEECEYSMPTTLDSGEKIVLNTRDYTVYKYDADDVATDLYSICDPTKIFQWMPRGRVTFTYSLLSSETTGNLIFFFYTQRFEPRTS